MANVDLINNTVLRRLWGGDPKDIFNAFFAALGSGNSGVCGVDAAGLPDFLPLDGQNTTGKYRACYSTDGVNWTNGNVSTRAAPFVLFLEGLNPGTVYEVKVQSKRSGYFHDWATNVWAVSDPEEGP